MPEALHSLPRRGSATGFWFPDLATVVLEDMFLLISKDIQLYWHGGVIAGPLQLICWLLMIVSGCCQYKNVIDDTTASISSAVCRLMLLYHHR